MKISMRATKSRLKNAKDKWYVLCKWEGKDWIVIVPFEYFEWPRFLITKWNHHWEKGLFIEGEWYIYHSKERAIEKWEREARENWCEGLFVFEFIF